MDTFANPITQVLDDFKASVLGKDVDAFVALYDPGLSIFDMWGVWSYDGIEPWRQMVERWFSSVGTDRVIVDFSDVKTIVTKELALVHAFIKYKALDTEGKELRSMDNRFTATLRQNGDGWKIVHQHTSSPIDPATISVMFKR